MVNHDVVAIFDLMDKWRHLPNYQLERRADIFFAYFLHEILEGARNLKIHPVIVPEFPVHKGTIKPEITNNTSNNIDYVVFSEDLSETYLIELKTDDKSRRPEEDEDLAAARKKGFEALLGGGWSRSSIRRNRNESTTNSSVCWRTLGSIRYQTRCMSYLLLPISAE